MANHCGIIVDHSLFPLNFHTHFSSRDSRRGSKLRRSRHT